MDTFATLWDEAGDNAEAEAGLRALTSARIAVVSSWTFLSVAKDASDFNHRFALIEDRVREAADTHGVPFEALAKSLVDDFRVMAASGDGVVKGGKDGCSHDFDFRNKCKKCDGQMSFPKKSSKTAAFYVESDGEKVGGPYDSKADAQDAIDGGDVSGDDLSVSSGGDEDSDGDDSDSDEDQDDSEGEPSDSNPFSGGDSKADDDEDDEDDKGGNPFAKKESKVAARADMLDRLSDHRSGHNKAPGTSAGEVYKRNFQIGSQMASSGSHTPEEINDHALKHRTMGHPQGSAASSHAVSSEGRTEGHAAADGILDGAGLGYGAGGYAQGPSPANPDAPHQPRQQNNGFGMPRGAALDSALSALFPVIAAHNVVHQPGETVFVDHFMGGHEHEGRKGVWAQVVHSPGQHGHDDRADSHLLKPMEPGGSHFFHHFGGLNKTAMDYNMAHEEHRYEHGQDGWKSGLGSYSHGDEDKTPGYAWKPHRVYDSLSSAVNHLAGGHAGGIEEVAHHLQSYNHCNGCDHVYSTNHPDHQTAGHKDVCPNCNDTDFHETASDVLQESHSGEHDGAGEAHSEDNYGDPYGKMDRHRESSLKTALPDGVDPLDVVLQTVPQGQGQAEREAHHDESVQLTSALISRFASVYNQYKSE